MYSRDNININVTFSEPSSCDILRNFIMDPSLGFAQLLGIASVNQKDRTTTDKNKLLKSEVGGPSKLKREKGKVAPNVQKFLQKQEQEEKRKKVEAKLKLEKLNEMRSDRAKK